MADAAGFWRYTERMALTRRDFGRNVLAGVAATTLVGNGACSSSGVDATDAGSGGTTGGGDGGNQCTLYPRQTEGPFYLDLDSLRRDITEGKAGMPLSVVVQGSE